MKHLYALCLSICIYAGTLTAQESEKQSPPATDLVIDGNDDFKTSDYLDMKQIADYPALASKDSFPNFAKILKHLERGSELSGDLCLESSDIVLGDYYRVKRVVCIVDARKSKVKYENVPVFEDALCVKVKETSTYSFQDNVTSIVTRYHYYWYSIFFTDYFARYTQRILYTPQYVILSYDEELSQHNLHYLENNCINSIAKTVSVFPNPIAEQPFFVRLHSTMECECKLTLLNTQGNAVKELNYKCLKGINTFKIDVSELAKGLYGLTGECNGQFFSEKLIIE